MSQTTLDHLSETEISHFLEHGYIKVSRCFSREAAATLTSNVWTRLGMSPTDKSTWHTHRTNMPAHHTFSGKEFAPKAWSAICDLLGGEEKIAEGTMTWNDALIVNLGTAENEERQEEGVHLGKDLREWHVDGDFFTHFLDSPEQGLLVIPLFTDIRAGGGGTAICPPAVSEIAKYLHSHPEGVPPLFIPGLKDEGPLVERLRFFNDLAASFPASAFVEVTGEIGDVFLLHPFMLHSASENHRRDVRIITNPPVAVKEPFCLDREDPNEYSPVERKTLKCLGSSRLEGWKIEGKREAAVPERIRLQQKMMEQELERLNHGAASQDFASDSAVSVSG